MRELRRDPITGRWVIINTDEITRPDDFEVEKHEKVQAEKCPFCKGHETMTPPEIYAFREGGSAPDTPGWDTRVVPNKFPALRIEGDLDKTGVGIYDMSQGIGAHEIIIETPDHFKEMAEMFDHEVEKVIWMYRDRSVDLERDTRLKYILIFKNYGKSAGASLEHPHSQLIALPIVPKRVSGELEGARKYFDYRERCIFCDIIRQELQERERIVGENSRFISLAPFVSRFPFETWILPKAHCSEFTHIEKSEVVDLARILKDTLLRIKRTLRDPSFNFLIHSSPIEEKDLEEYHWHIEIMPTLTKLAGFEWGTGFYINLVAPEAAAEYLRSVKL